MGVHDWCAGPLCIPWTYTHHKIARRHEQHLHATRVVFHSPRQLCFRDALEKIRIGDNLRIRILLENFSPRKWRCHCSRCGLRDALEKIRIDDNLGI